MITPVKLPINYKMRAVRIRRNPGTPVADDGRAFANIGARSGKTQITIPEWQYFCVVKLCGAEILRKAESEMKIFHVRPLPS
jgi:hypothetical protein